MSARVSATAVSTRHPIASAHDSSSIEVPHSAFICKIDWVRRAGWVGVALARLITIDRLRQTDHDRLIVIDSLQLRQRALCKYSRLLIVCTALLTVYSTVLVQLRHAWLVALTALLIGLHALLNVYGTDSVTAARWCTADCTALLDVLFVRLIVLHC